MAQIKNMEEAGITPRNLTAQRPDERLIPPRLSLLIREFFIPKAEYFWTLL
jgi:hypothetical protein